MHDAAAVTPAAASAKLMNPARDAKIRWFFLEMSKRVCTCVGRTVQHPEAPLAKRWWLIPPLWCAQYSLQRKSHREEGREKGEGGIEGLM